MFDVPRLAQNRRPVHIDPLTPTKGQAAELALIIAYPLSRWIANLERILATYDPAPEITRDSPADSEAAINAVEGEINVLILSVDARVREWAVRVERWHRRKWTGSIYSATNVDLRNIMTGTAVQESIEAFIARNVALIKDVNGEAQRRISDAVFRGYQQRLPARTIAQEIRKAVGS
jgi:hypothetical protein